jgi:hypothetical protein
MDFEMAIGGFSDTEIVVRPLSERARAAFAEKFGAGAVSVTLPKSQGFAFEAWADSAGFGLSFPVTKTGSDAKACSERAWKRRSFSRAAARR